MLWTSMHVDVLSSHVLVTFDYRSLWFLSLHW